MADPGLPPKPRSLNLLEKLIQEEDAKSGKRGVGSKKPEQDKLDRFFDSISIPPAVDEQDSQKNNTKSSDTDLDKGNRKMKDKGQGQKGRSGSSKKKNGSKGKSKANNNVDDRRRNHADSPQNRKNKSERARKSTSRSQSSSRSGSRSRSASRSRSSSSSGKDHEHKSRRRSGSDSSDLYNHDREEPDYRKKNDESDSDSFFGNRKRQSNSESSRSDHGERRSGDDSSRSRSSSSYSSDNSAYRRRRKSSVSDSDQDRRGRKHRSKSSSSEREKRHKFSKELNIKLKEYKKRKGSSLDRFKQSKDSKDGQSRRKKRLLHRTKMRKFHSFELNPDIFLVERLQQKYAELDELTSTPFIDQKTLMTRQQFHQMQLLRDQYVYVSHGQAPKGVLVPRSLPEEVRKQSYPRPMSAKERSKETEWYDTPYEDDLAYGTLRSVIVAEKARKANRVRTEILIRRPPSGKKSSKNKKKSHKSADTSVSEKTDKISTTTNSTITSSRGKSPPGIDHHIKYSENETLKKWLKEKDKLYRKQKAKERAKKRDEHEKAILEANKEFERMMQSEKTVKEWMTDKKKEAILRKKEEKKQKKQEEKDVKKVDISLPGKDLTIRSQSAPPRHRSKQEGSSKSKITEADLKGEETREHVREKIHEERLIEEERKQTKAAKDGHLPPQTKFMYKRPVAGNIKFKMPQKEGAKGETERNKVIKKETSNEDKAKDARMSYDQWLLNKRKEDTEKKNEAERKKDMTKSEPELANIIPEMAKRRIENIKNKKKRVDTGIKKIDDELNTSFGGADFDSEASQEEITKQSYKWTDNSKSDHPSTASKQFKGSSASPGRPKTAPPGKARVPAPKLSKDSPRKVVVTKKVDEIMSEENKSNPFKLPFPPEEGTPRHVASMQRKLFADQINKRLSEEERPEPQGCDATDQKVVSTSSAQDSSTESGNKEQLTAQKCEREKSDKSESATDMSKIEKEQIVGTSNVKDGASKTEKNDSIRTQKNQKYESKMELKDNPVKDHPATETNKDTSMKEKAHRKFEETKKSEVKTESHEISSEKSESAKDQSITNEQLNVPKEESNYQEHEAEVSEEIEEDVVEDSEQQKNSKDCEPTAADKLSLDLNGNADDEEVSLAKDENLPLSPKFASSQDFENSVDNVSPPLASSSMKHVSFSEKTEVIEASDDYSSTDTQTPEPPDLDPEIEGLDAQPDIDFDFGDKNSYEHVSFSIGGFNLRPAIIPSNDVDETCPDDVESAEQDKESTFITNPESGC